MTGLELDQQIRAILLTCTRETSLTSTKALMELGFGAPQAVKIVCDVIEARERPQEFPLGCKA